MAEKTTGLQKARAMILKRSSRHAWTPYRQIKTALKGKASSEDTLRAAQELITEGAIISKVVYGGTLYQLTEAWYEKDE